MKETATTEGELGEPLFIKNSQGMRLLGYRNSKYRALGRQGKIIIVGEKRASRTYYPSIKAYAAQLLAEAEAKKAAALLAEAEAKNAAA